MVAYAVACVHLPAYLALYYHARSFIRPSRPSVGLKESAQSSRQINTTNDWKHSAATGTEQGSTTDKREYWHERRAPSRHALSGTPILPALLNLR
ncbi:hypothetical protein ACSS6W_007808 [Trichoderma asperelloides]